MQAVFGLHEADIYTKVCIYAGFSIPANDAVKGMDE